MDETNWYQAKQILSKYYKGRAIVEWADNHLQTKRKFLKKDHVVYNTDCQNQVKAYVNDFCQYLDVSNKENKRILEKSNLI